MTHRETDLDRITTLLGQCLGRIDEQAFRLQRLDEDAEDYGATDVLESEAAALQELVGSLLYSSGNADHSDLNRTTDQSVRDCLGELDVPVVVRQRLAANLPPIACRPGQLAFAVRRALTLGISRLEAGGEIVITTRREGETALLELETQGERRDRHLQERAATLCEFVAGFHGACRIDVDDRGTLLLALELPTVLTADEL